VLEQQEVDLGTLVAGPTLQVEVIEGIRGHELSDQGCLAALTRTQKRHHAGSLELNPPEADSG
jgi:hypothetical protein